MATLPTTWSCGLSSRWYEIAEGSAYCRSTTDPWVSFAKNEVVKRTLTILMDSRDWMSWAKSCRSTVGSRGWGKIWRLQFQRKHQNRSEACPRAIIKEEIAIIWRSPECYFTLLSQWICSPQAKRFDRYWWPSTEEQPMLSMLQKAV